MHTIKDITEATRDDHSRIRIYTVGIGEPGKGYRQHCSSSTIRSMIPPVDDNDKVLKIMLHQAAVRSNSVSRHGRQHHSIFQQRLHSWRSATSR